MNKQKTITENAELLINFFRGREKRGGCGLCRTSKEV